MITVYHLGASQSERIVWLLEELGLPYALEWFDRGPDGLAPPEYLALHPAATAPVIRDGDTLLAESAAICEYLCWRHAGGALSVGPDQPNYPDYLYWLQMNNNLLGLFFARSAMRGLEDQVNPVIAKVVSRRETAYYQYMEQCLAENPYLAGDAFSCADIMTLFSLTTLAARGSKVLEALPNVKAYVARVSARPAYVKAMAIAGPQAQRP